MLYICSYIWSMRAVELTDHRCNMCLKLQALSWIWSGEEDNPFYHMGGTVQKINRNHSQKPHTTPSLWMRKDIHSLGSHSSMGQQAKYLCQA